MHKVVARIRRRHGAVDEVDPSGGHRHALITVAVVAVLAVVVVLHLTGVIGAGSH